MEVDVDEPFAYLIRDGGEIVLRHPVVTLCVRLREIDLE